MQRILGIDPGLVATGYAVIESDGHSSRLLTSGIIGAKSDELSVRLRVIFDELSDVVEKYTPQVAAVEAVFIYKDASAALKLGQARGAAICAVGVHSIPVYEYDTRVVKKNIVGKGNASKEQIQFMVARLLQISTRHKDDEADAMALALCHAFSHHSNTKIAEATR